MPGEIWTGEFRAGVETTYGTAVTPTRRLYWEAGSGLVPGGTAIRTNVLTGTRAQAVSGRRSVSEPSGSFSFPMESGEILEALEIGINGTPTVTTPGGGTTTRLHVYTAPGTLDSMTLQYHDGARPWQQAGVYANTLRVAGSAREANTVSGDLFGAAHTQTALSGTVTSRTPSPILGYETQLFIDTMSGADNYGSTVIAAAQSIINWDVALAANNLGRLYTAANTLSMQSATMGIYDMTGSVTFVASGARALTEYNDFNAGTLKRLRLHFGDNVVLEGVLKAFVDLDLPILWTEFNLLGDEAGVRTYEASFQYVTDTVTGFASRVRAQNGRSAAWA